MAGYRLLLQGAGTAFKEFGRKKGAHLYFFTGDKRGIRGIFSIPKCPLLFGYDRTGYFLALNPGRYPALLSAGIVVAPKNFWHGYPNLRRWIIVDEENDIKEEVFDDLAEQLKELET